MHFGGGYAAARSSSRPAPPPSPPAPAASSFSSSSLSALESAVAAAASSSSRLSLAELLPPDSSLTLLQAQLEGLHIHAGEPEGVSVGLGIEDEGADVEEEGGPTPLQLPQPAAPYESYAQALTSPTSSTSRPARLARPPDSSMRGPGEDSRSSRGRRHWAESPSPPGSPPLMSGLWRQEAVTARAARAAHDAVVRAQLAASPTGTGAPPAHVHLLPRPPTLDGPRQPGGSSGGSHSHGVIGGGGLSAGARPFYPSSPYLQPAGGSGSGSGSSEPPVRRTCDPSF